MSLAEEAEALAEMHVGRKRDDRTESVMVSSGVSNSSSSKDKLLPVINNLLEQVVARDNMLLAYERVCANKGVPGIDHRSVHDLKGYLQKHWGRIKYELLNGSYKPLAVLRVEIPKPDGGVRRLGIPTFVDRLIQQALHQTLSPIFELEFSDHSYGFRPGRNAHQAVKAVQRYQYAGYKYVVDMDLKSFFDEVNHDLLMGLLRRRITDVRILKLVRSYLQSGIMIGGLCNIPVKGTPQGGPLSPLLSNIMLHELDQELESRGHHFCRYADDCNIYVKTRRSGERVLASIADFVESKLKLKVNWNKSAVAHPSRRKFLGFSFTMDRKVRISPQARKRFKTKVKDLCRMGKGRNLENFILFDLNPYLKGWFNYFKLAEAKKTFAREMDEWIRHRLRNILWRQWKRPWTRFQNLMKRGLGEERAASSAFNKHGPWFNSGASHMNQAVKVKEFRDIGLFSLLEKC